MPKETTSLSGKEQKDLVKDMTKVMLDVKHRSPVDPPIYDPQQIVATWNGSDWIIDINDNMGHTEISPRQKNLLLQRLNLFLNRRFRAHRVKSRAAAVSVTA